MFGDVLLASAERLAYLIIGQEAKPQQLQGESSGLCVVTLLNGAFSTKHKVPGGPELKRPGILNPQSTDD
jgi:hypothetical protein